MADYTVRRKREFDIAFLGREMTQVKCKWCSERASRVCSWCHALICASCVRTAEKGAVCPGCLFVGPGDPVAVVKAKEEVEMQTARQNISGLRGGPSRDGTDEDGTDDKNNAARGEGGRGRERGGRQARQVPPDG